MALNVALFTGSAVTISATEFSLINSSTSIAANTTVCVATLFLDVNNMAAGDEYEIALQEKAISGGTQRRLLLADLVGLQNDPLFVMGPFILGVGWDFTVKKIAGTDRAFTWSIRSAS